MEYLRIDAVRLDEDIGHGLNLVGAPPDVEQAIRVEVHCCLGTVKLRKAKCLMERPRSASDVAQFATA